MRFGVVEAVNSNIGALIRRGRGYKNIRYLPLKAEFLVLRKAAWEWGLLTFLRRAVFTNPVGTRPRQLPRKWGFVELTPDATRVSAAPGQWKVTV